VREYSVPATTEVKPDAALTDMLTENVTQHGDDVGLRRQVGGRWEDVTWRRFGEQVAGVAKGLVAAGVQPGDRVALQAKTRYEWPLLDFAIWTAGAVTVPVYETSSPDQVAWILADSGAVAAIVERAEHAVAVVVHVDGPPGEPRLAAVARAVGVEVLELRAAHAARRGAAEVALGLDVARDQRDRRGRAARGRGADVAGRRHLAHDAVARLDAARHQGVGEPTRQRDEIGVTVPLPSGRLDGRFVWLRNGCGKTFEKVRGHWAGTRSRGAGVARRSLRTAAEATTSPFSAKASWFFSMSSKS
jgi:hypothetical protein